MYPECPETSDRSSGAGIIIYFEPPEVGTGNRPWLSIRTVNAFNHYPTSVASTLGAFLMWNNVPNVYL